MKRPDRRIADGTSVGTQGIAAVAIAAAALVGSAHANIDLEWRPLTQTVAVGEQVQIGLYAVSDDPEADQPIASLDVLPGWDPDHLQLLGVQDNGPYDWLWSTFPDDSGGDGMNDTWNDGNAKYTALAQPGAGHEAWATPDGLLVTTFEFLVLWETPAPEPTELFMIPGFGEHSWTKVRPPGGGDVTGTLSDPALITIVPEPSCLVLLLGASLVGWRRRRLPVAPLRAGSVTETEEKR
jgi:hypothetical protein